MQKVPGGERERGKEGGRKEREVRRVTDIPLSKLPENSWCCKQGRKCPWEDVCIGSGLVLLLDGKRTVCHQSLEY